MISKTTKHVANAVAAGVALAALHMATPAAAFSTGMYDLFNHPDGVLTSSSVHYGLRLDAICNRYWGICGSVPEDDEKTFSVESSLNVASVWLDWGLNDTDYTKARITGTLHYNDADPELASDWTITYNLNNIQAISGADPTAGDPGGAVNGWYVDAQDAQGNYNTWGELVRVEDGLTIYLKGVDMGGAFIFDDDGHRCAGYGPPSDQSMCDQSSSSEIVARGWLKIKKQGTSYWKDYGSNDWLVIAKPKNPPQEMPEPGTMALFGIGLVGLGYARRRRFARA